MSTTFRDQAHMYAIFDAFIRKVMSDPDVGSKLQKAKLKIRFNFTDPAGCVFLNFADPAPEGQFGTFAIGDDGAVADVTMTQTAELANRFWQGKQNAVTAVATGKIKATGKVQKALSLVGAVKPAFALYKQTLRAQGSENLIVP